MDIEDFISQDPFIQWIREFSTLEQALEAADIDYVWEILNRYPAFASKRKLVRLAERHRIVSGDVKEILKRLKPVVTAGELKWTCRN